MKPTACWIWAFCPISAILPSPARRQTLFFSATIPPVVELSRLHNPATMRWSAARHQPSSPCGISFHSASAGLRMHLLERATSGRARLHPDEASSQPPRRAPRATWAQYGADSRESIPDAANRGIGGIQNRTLPRARRNRHRRTRHRRDGPGPRRELRRAGGAGRLHPSGRSTGRAGRPGQRSRWRRRRRKAVFETSSARSTGGCPA
jgi:hypothetical protein